MTILEQLDKGCPIMKPNKQIIWKKTIIGFVDDKQQYTNDWLNNCLNTTTNNLQEAA